MDNYTNRNLPRRARRPRRSIGLAKQQDDYGSGSAIAQATDQKQASYTKPAIRQRVRATGVRARFGHAKKKLQDRRHTRCWMPSLFMMAIFSPFIIASILSVLFGSFGLFRRVPDASVFTWQLSLATGFYFFVRTNFQGADAASIGPRIIVAIVMAFVYVSAMFFAVLIYTMIFGCAVMNDCPMIC
jgi:hypothetical protein